MVTSNTAEQLVMGTEHDSEFLDMDGDRVHIFDCLRSSPVALRRTSLGDIHWGSDQADVHQLRTSLEATLQILEPTIVVIQGVKVWKRCRNVLIPRKALSKHLIECELDDRRVLVAPLTHPSARHPHRWDSPTSAYFKEVGRPTLRGATMLAS
jgi:hypothetical protein